jgi:hypothetical protein
VNESFNFSTRARATSNAAGTIQANALKNTMKINSIFDTNTYLRLTLMVPAIALMGITGCSTADPTAEHNYTHTYVTISSCAYNTESRGFDRPWPFGPESNQQ